jgi:AbiV family abortive infection protein
MATKAITQYYGPLSVEQAAAGIHSALENAKSLLADAELLLENGRWARAAALAILAIEEAGKVPTIRALLLSRDANELREEWRAYRSHTKKNVLWILPELAAKGARFLDDLRPTMDPASDHPQILETIKQLAFYTDAYGKCHWSSPVAAIPEGLAKSMVTLARLLAAPDQGMTTAEELTLWVKHMASVWKGPMWEMSQALAACYQEAEEKGLLRGTSSASSMTKFLFGIR